MDAEKWIICPGCSGEIGLPPDWPAEVVCCPQCASVVRISERMRVLWRPAEQGTGAAAQSGGSVEWIACHGCGGDIGAPPEWMGPTIACPKCGSIVAMRETGRILWRPAKTDQPPALRVGADGAYRTTATVAVAPIDWSRQIWSMGFIFLSSIFVASILSLTAQTLDRAFMSLAIGFFVGCGIAAVASLGCWWILLTKMFERGHTLLAATAFVVLPASYLPVFFYGWARSKELNAERTLLVWTYCFAIALCLGAAWFVGGMLSMAVR